MNEPRLAVGDDRGLGTAYERYHFYRRMEEWAARYQIESLLEGPFDGMAGVPGVHGVGLARKGISVTSVVDSLPQVSVTRAIYDAAGAKSANVVALGERGAEDLASLPKADMVLVYHAFAFVPDWREHLRLMAKHARKLFVVAVCNPENWGVTFVRMLAKARGVRGPISPESWHTDQLAPVLWEVGRVKEHQYFDCPWWPDLPVSPGQSLADRLKKLIVADRDADSLMKREGGELAQKYVFNREKWPYFGGPGWADELSPGLSRHPTFENAPTALRAKTAHLHAFVVDVSPRTPRARRKLTE